MKCQNCYMIFLIGLILISGPALTADEMTGEEINWQVISGGAVFNGSSTLYGLSSIVNQTAVGEGSSTNYNIIHGFLQNFTSVSGCCDYPGDASNNGILNLLDLIYVINFLYKSGPAPACIDEADANGNNVLNILDVTYSINYMYKGGPAPICGTTGT